MKNCDSCGSKVKKYNFYFKIAKEDTFGFIVLCIVLAAPIGFLAFIWGVLEPLLPVGFSFLLLAISLFKKDMIYIYSYTTLMIIVETFNLFLHMYTTGQFSGFTALAPEMAFILSFYGIGFGVYRFLSLLVDYKLSVSSTCLSCNKATSIISLPKH
ncbi:MAG: hypothetical protein ACI8SR_000383 [Oceanicoccus sp.]|jgi:hypothetical protein